MSAVRSEVVHNSCRGFPVPVSQKVVGVVACGLHKTHYFSTFLVFVHLYMYGRKLEIPKQNVHDSLLLLYLIFDLVESTFFVEDISLVVIHTTVRS